MSSLETLYQEITAQITNNLPQIAGVYLWNGQLDVLDKEYPYAYPAVFVDFFNLDYEALNDKYQICTCSLRLNIIQESYLKEPVQIFELANGVNKYINYFTLPSARNPCQRTHAYSDTSYTNMYNFCIEYSFDFIDYEAYNDDNIIPWTIAEIDLEVDYTDEDFDSPGEEKTIVII